ncbi:MAG: SprT family zinc-dependent metalloprotease [Opitutaceae bacterium]|nr:SprT family zinc-dependent metalloprotease [Opitutaceae bacterium]
MGEIVSSGRKEAILGKDEISFRRRSNARRYIAKVDSNGEIVVTIPRGGTQREALAFAQKHGEWLRGQQIKSRETLSEKGLHAGDRFWFRGERVELTVSTDWGRPVLRFSDQQFFIADAAMNLSRPLAEHLRGLAQKELPVLANELATRFDLSFKRVSIRDQKTRWGSCSGTGAISLNWRIVLAPPETAEYIVIHELMHLKEMNHSPAFWGLVERACRRYKEHERWLDEHQTELNW